jgi:hypothetical protein
MPVQFACGRVDEIHYAGEHAPSFRSVIASKGGGPRMPGEASSFVPRSYWRDAVTGG